MQTIDVALLRLLGPLAAGSIHAADAPRDAGQRVLNATFGDARADLHNARRCAGGLGQPRRPRAGGRSGEGPRYEPVADIVVGRSQPLRVGETVILQLE